MLIDELVGSVAERCWAFMYGFRLDLVDSLMIKMKTSNILSHLVLVLKLVSKPDPISYKITRIFREFRLENSKKDKLSEWKNLKKIDKEGQT